jgi:hypothetical protein
LSSTLQCGHIKIEEFYRVYMNMCKVETKCIDKILKNRMFDFFGLK